MLTGVFGLPGAGKTTLLCALADRAINQKPLYIGHRPFWTQPIGEFTHYEKIYCNFPMVGAYKLNFEHLGLFDFSRSLILIDEIATLANARDWKQFGNQKVEFFAKHRHLKTDIIYCSQSYRNMDITIRDITAQLLYITKDGEYTRVCPIEKGFRVEPSIEEAYSLKARLYSSRFKRKKYYHMFDSYEHKELPENPSEAW